MRELYLASDEIDCQSAFSFYCKLHEFENQGDGEILVHLHTNGGGWDDGLSIYDNILYSNSDVTAIGHGCVYSVGTIIMQACKKRYLMPNCSFMIHYGSCSISSEHKSAMGTMEYFKESEEKMLDIYVKRCQKGQAFLGHDEKKIKNFIRTTLDKKGDWYMSAEDAVHYGFADKVLTKREYCNVRKAKQRSNKSA